MRCRTRTTHTSGFSAALSERLYASPVAEAVRLVNFPLHCCTSCSIQVTQIVRNRKHTMHATDAFVAFSRILHAWFRTKAVSALRISTWGPARGVSFAILRSRQIVHKAICKSCLNGDHCELACKNSNPSPLLPGTLPLKASTGELFRH